MSGLSYLIHTGILINGIVLFGPVSSLSEDFDFISNMAHGPYCHLQAHSFIPILWPLQVLPHSLLMCMIFLSAQGSLAASQLFSGIPVS